MKPKNNYCLQALVATLTYYRDTKKLYNFTIQKFESQTIDKTQSNNTGVI